MLSFPYNIEGSGQNRSAETFIRILFPIAATADPQKTVSTGKEYEKMAWDFPAVSSIGTVELATSDCLKPQYIAQKNKTKSP